MATFIDLTIAAAICHSLSRWGTSLLLWVFCFLFAIPRYSACFQDEIKNLDHHTLRRHLRGSNKACNLFVHNRVSNEAASVCSLSVLITVIIYINPYIDPKAELCYAKQSHPPRTAFFGFEMYETWLIFGALRTFFLVYINSYLAMLVPFKSCSTRA